MASIAQDKAVTFDPLDPRKVLDQILERRGGPNKVPERCKAAALRDQQIIDQLKQALPEGAKITTTTQFERFVDSTVNILLADFTTDLGMFRSTVLVDVPRDQWIARTASTLTSGTPFPRMSDQHSTGVGAKN